MGRIHGYFNADVTPNELRTVAALQRHGGADRALVARGADWGLGTNVPPGAGPPERLDEPGARITAVHDGEFYNHDELRGRLRRLGQPPGCAVLPALYAAHGERFTDRLDGRFAVALVDRRDRTTLVLATDRTGTKSIYYRWDPAERTLHFSSELPALLGFRAVTAAVWEPALDRYLAAGVLLGEQTVFEEIKVLPPGAMLRCVLGGSPTITPGAAPVEPGPVPEPGAALRAEVRHLLTAEQPIAVLASGGTGAGALTAVAAERGHVHAFTLAGQPGGTRPPAGTTRHRVAFDPDRIPELAEEVVWHLGQPHADPAALGTYLLFTAAAERGFRLVLTDDGAGDILGRPAGDPGAFTVLPDRHRLYTVEYRRLAGGARRAEPDVTGLQLRRRLAADCLRRADHLGMARSVAARLPYCRPRVVHSALQIGAGRLAGALGHRPQLSSPVAAALAPGTPLWSYAHDVLAPSRLRAAGQLDPQAVGRLLAVQAERPTAGTAAAIWALLVFEIWREQFHGNRRLAGLALALS